MINDKILFAIEKTLSSPTIYIQSFSLIVSFAIAYFAYRVFRKIFFPRILAFSIRQNVELNRIVSRYFIPMAYPVFTSLFLLLGMILSKIFLKDNFLFTITLQLVLLFLFLRFMRISSNSIFITNFIGFFLMPAMILEILGLLDYVITYLDEFSIKLGAIRISIYVIIKSIIVLMIVFWVSGLITRKSKSYIDDSKGIKSGTKLIIGKFIDIFVYCAVAIIILKTIGVDMTTFAVLGGAIGVGIGFGLQKIASNFISGIILLFEKSIEVGDWVEIDNGNIFGVVKHFSGRYTLIECFDGKEIMVPNEDFIVNKVSNWTYSNNRARIEINFAVNYGADLQKAIDIGYEVARQHPRCLTYPEIECFITNFSEFDIKLVLYFWISDITKGRMAVKSEAYLNLTKKLKENGIEIPIPKREIYVSEKDFIN